MTESIPEYKWYFAGEHTYPLYRGTVHGAFLSGAKAAIAIKNNELIYKMSVFLIQLIILACF